jgi:molybdopterin synthase catalytic subunit
MITKDPIDLNQFLSPSSDPASGASVFFVGKVRNHHDGKAVKLLYYECFEAMANKQIMRILERAKKKYLIHRVRALHRVGRLEVGDIAVVVEVSSSHRAEAFEACRAIIHEIKHEVPIWKKETYTNGKEEWVYCEKESF